jgi:type II secretory ATPase GspE/PulE/Tfp pilus assembly ATPase PilB-like protein
MANRASIVYIQLHHNYFVINFKIDNIFCEYLKMPIKFYSAVLSKIKLMSSKNDNIKLKLNNEDIEVNISILPVTIGEEVRLTLFNYKNLSKDISFLTMTTIKKKLV